MQFYYLLRPSAPTWADNEDILGFTLHEYASANYPSWKDVNNVMSTIKTLMYVAPNPKPYIFSSRLAVAFGQSIESGC